MQPDIQLFSQVIRYSLYMYLYADYFKQATLHLGLYCLIHEYSCLMSYLCPVYMSVHVLLYSYILVLLKNNTKSWEQGCSETLMCVNTPRLIKLQLLTHGQRRISRDFRSEQRGYVYVCFAVVNSGI